jgi:putative ABC transport system permease protein
MGRRPNTLVTDVESVYRLGTAVTSESVTEGMLTMDAVLLRTLLGVGSLALITTIVLFAYRVRPWWEPLGAVLRAAVQLAALSLVLSAVIGDIRWVWAALGVMFVTAVLTASHRLGGYGRQLGTVAGAMLLGVAMTLAVVFGSGAIEFSAQNLLAIGGIVVGNSMIITTLTGRRLRATLTSRSDEVEGWLALGATPRQARLDIARNAVREALIPSIDQTRTTGLVVLPGAFIGAVFAGASPIEAGRFQLIVLAAILAAGSIVAVTLVEALTRVATVPIGEQQD